MTKTTRKFETEVQQLLDLVIHSLYSNRDIFLRELISNGSDAIDKARFESHTDQSVLEGEAEGSIRLIPDKAAKTLTIRDNGIGMAREEVEKNIGTIAHSGTKSFVKSLQEQNVKEHPELIGQFGVGFYSSFMVADKVTVITRRAGQKGTGCRWESTGDGTYTIEDEVKETSGTDIILHLKEEMAEYLDDWKLRTIVKKYSDYVQYPIILHTVREEPVTGLDGKAIEGGGTIEKKVEETLNSMKAIWARPKSEVTEEEYQEFYNHISHDHEKPFRTIHWAAEGTSEFRALLYLPSHRPFDLLMREHKRGIHLYVKRVFITDNCESLVPEYLRFVRGVVDSSDLPLNVSREILQEDVQIKRIQKNLVSKVLATLAETKEKNQEEYRTFYQEFGAVLKEGIHFDYANREKIMDLALFETIASEPGKPLSLKEYVERMPEAQKEIYYITGESRQTLERSPHLEVLRKKGYDVLLLIDPIDEWVVQAVPEYAEKPLKAVDRGDLELASDEEKKEAENKKSEDTKQYHGLLDLLQERLKERVKEVRLSSRLTDSACCLVTDSQALNPHMEKILKAMNQEIPESKRILELNPDHPVLKVMARLYAKEKDHHRLGEYGELLYDQALLAEGMPLKDPMSFTRLLSEVMVAAAEKE